MHQKVEEEKDHAPKENHVPLNFVMRFYHEPYLQINDVIMTPTTSEIAAVFETADRAPPSHRLQYMKRKRMDYRK